MLLNLISGHFLKDHVLHHTRTQFHGCLDSACTMTCVIGFPKTYELFLPQSISTKQIFTSQKNCLYVFQSELCFVVF